MDGEAVSPDGRVEAQLQRVLSLYRAVERTERRVEDIRREQGEVDYKIRNGFERGSQARTLRSERDELEAFIRTRHEEIAKLLGDLGEDAAFLGGF